MSTSTSGNENGVLMMETELIRCKDCKFSMSGIDKYNERYILCQLHERSYGVIDDGFCMWAERKEDGTDVVNTTFTDKDAHFGEVVLRVIRDVDTPMLMYEGEKEAVKKALIMALDEWKERKEE